MKETKSSYNSNFVFMGWFDINATTLYISVNNYDWVRIINPCDNREYWWKS